MNGDELIFVERGTGEIETDFGPLEFVEGDYVVVPLSLTPEYRSYAQDQQELARTTASQR